MPGKLDEIPWMDPLLPLVDDPEWRAEVEWALGAPNPCYLLAAPSPWLREGLLNSARLRFPNIGIRDSWLVYLVTSQENSCRYCYGGARAYLKFQGLSEGEIDGVEREIQMAGGSVEKAQLLRFCRDLSRSIPRPSKDHVDALVAQGFTPIQVQEAAAAVVAATLVNRYATFVAAPIDGIEEPSGLVFRLIRPILVRLRPYPRPLEPRPTPDTDGPFGVLVDAVRETELAPILHDLLSGALSSQVLSRRTTAWIFAVVASVLSCRTCEGAARRLLEAEGISPARVDSVVQSLAGDELDKTEALLVPWARETVHYDVANIQRHTRELAGRVGNRTALEAIGVAGLANACARLSLLTQ